jgi:glutamate 5-kinase
MDRVEKTTTFTCQGRLMKVYDDLFGYFDVTVAQVLLSRGDLAQV